MLRFHTRLGTAVRVCRAATAIHTIVIAPISVCVDGVSNQTVEGGTPTEAIIANGASGTVDSCTGIAPAIGELLRACSIDLAELRDGCFKTGGVIWATWRAPGTAFYAKAWVVRNTDSVLAHIWTGALRVLSTSIRYTGIHTPISIGVYGNVSREAIDRNGAFTCTLITHVLVCTIDSIARICHK